MKRSSIETRAVGRSGLSARDLVGEAVAGLGRRTGRAVLTALGTVLGVGAFVATLGLTGTAAAQIGARFDALEATEVVLQDGDPGRPYDPPFPADAERRVTALNGVRAAGVTWVAAKDGAAVRASPVGGDAGSEVVLTLLAASPGGLEAMSARVEQGRLYDSLHRERADRVALLGIAAARRLGVDRLDQQPAVLIDDRPFTVLGIVSDAGRNADLLLSVVVPETTARDVWGPPETAREIVVRTDLGAAQLVARQAPLALRPHDPERLTVVVPPRLETLRNDVASDVDSLFLLLAGVSLVIGAIGIANITLVSVLERISEIGLRRSLGATRRHVTLQFLVESTLLGTAGGVVGTSIGIVVVSVVAFARSWTTVMEPALIAAAPLIGTVTGLLAGLYPALRAARVEPIEALRR